MTGCMRWGWVRVLQQAIIVLFGQNIFIIIIFQRFSFFSHFFRKLACNLTSKKRGAQLPNSL
jgi:hypothetical protein